MSMLRAYLSQQTVDALEKVFGGQTIQFPVPRSGKLWERLVSGIGEDHAEQCRKWLPGEKVYIPASAEKNSRDKAIREMHSQGLSAKEIAEIGFVSRLSERHILRIIEKRTAP